MNYGHNWSYDPEVDAWYFHLDEVGDVCRTEALGSRIVNIDYGHSGNVIGVEVL